MSESGNVARYMAWCCIAMSGFTDTGFGGEINGRH